VVEAKRRGTHEYLLSKGGGVAVAVRRGSEYKAKELESQAP